MVDTPNSFQQELRLHMRERRASLDTATCKQHGLAFRDNLIELLSNRLKLSFEHQIEKPTECQCAGYLAFGGEMDVIPALDALRDRGARTSLPIMTHNTLHFAPFDAHTPLLPGRYNIPVPDVPDDKWLTPVQLQLVLVPLVAFDPEGNRLGMGGGFYDRSFAYRLGAPGSADSQATATRDQVQWLIGAAHDFQKVDALDAESWDVPLDAVVTESNIYTFRH